jgi:hypothetical protein
MDTFLEWRQNSKEGSENETERKPPRRKNMLTMGMG